MAEIGEKQSDSIAEESAHGRQSDTIVTGADKAALELEAVERHTQGEKPTLWMWILTAVAGISGLLFGYDTGVISGALVVIGGDLGPTELSNQQKELITAATSLGALLAGIGSGALADIIGRKWVIAVADVVFIVGAVIQAVAQGVWVMIAGRFVIGLGVGLASLIVPLYIAELSPAPFRGRMIVINVLFITFGQVVAYAIGAGLEFVSNGWRIMVGIGAIPAGVQLVSIYWLPESPRFLIRKGRNSDAKHVLSKIYKGEEDAELDKKVRYIEEYINEDVRRREGSGLTRWQIWRRDFKELYTVGRNFRALVIACGLQGIQQLCGFNSLMYFSATIFKSVGFEKSIAVSMIVAGTNFLMTCIAFTIIDRVGRRRILIGTIWGMSLGLTICAIAFSKLPRDPITNEIISNSTNKWTLLILASQIIYVIFYALGIGNVPWLSQSEIFSYNVRGLGTGMATATNWAGNLLIGSTFLTMMEKMSPSGAFGFYAGLCALGWVGVVICYPELSGLGLEEVGKVLENGFGVSESRKLRKEVKERRRLEAEERQRGGSEGTV